MNNVLLNTQLHFIIILVRAGMSLPAFLLLKIDFLVKFLYYIRNRNKYKRKAVRADLYLKNPV